MEDIKHGLYALAIAVCLHGGCTLDSAKKTTEGTKEIASSILVLARAVENRK